MRKDEPTKRTIWSSLHQEYLRYSYESLKKSKDPSVPLLVRLLSVDKDVIDTVRYSYDCLEAATEFLFHLWDTNQLGRNVPSNWGTNHLCRQWRSLALSHRLGLLAFSWDNVNFWPTENSWKLFRDFKELRDGLTHPRPTATEETYIVEKSHELEKGTYEERQHLETKLKHGLIGRGGGYAGFHQVASDLDYTDGEKAFEILIRHLIRITDLVPYFATWLRVFDPVDLMYYSVTDLLVFTRQLYDSDW